MQPFDTGLNAPESVATLLLQQSRLVRGLRAVQMFPAGINELGVPAGMLRTENDRGVFHYDPEQIGEDRILEISSQGRENVFLELGPYSKEDVLRHILNGENLITIMEVTPDLIEIRAAAGCHSTIMQQTEYFERTKEESNMVVCIKAPVRAMRA